MLSQIGVYGIKTDHVLPVEVVWKVCDQCIITPKEDVFTVNVESWCLLVSQTVCLVLFDSTVYLYCAPV